MKKYILVHSGARDQYKIVEILNRNDLLAFFVTDDIFFRKEYKSLIPSGKIKISSFALFFRVLEKIFPKKKFNQQKDFWLSRKAGKMSLRYKYPIFAYSYYATEAFSLSNEHPKILFQLHPHPISVKNILESEIKANPLAKNSLSQEIELHYTRDEFNILTKETILASDFITTSTFTQKTLIENGIVEDLIEVVPYGVDVSEFIPRKQFRAINKGEQIRLLFVGSFNQRKGLSYLLQAVSELQKEGNNLSLTLCGRGIMDYEMLDHFYIKELNVKNDIPKSDLVKLMHESDLFVFPSLCEGFGLVLLEAMATGLPVITTNRTGGLDFIDNEVEGFVIEAQSVEALKHNILRYSSHPKLLQTMGEAAIKKVEKYSWGQFEMGIVKCIHKFENRK